MAVKQEGRSQNTATASQFLSAAIAIYNVWLTDHAPPPFNPYRCHPGGGSLVMLSSKVCALR